MTVFYRYTANCDYKEGKFNWYIRDEDTGRILCTSKTPHSLLTALRRYMKNHLIDEITLFWENNNKPQTVKIRKKKQGVTYERDQSSICSSSRREKGC